MKKGNRILCLCAALFALIIIGGLVHTAPALAWDTWPAGTHNDPNHTWTVVFDKAMNTATINSQNIYVSNDIQGSSRVTGVSVRASDSKHALVAPPAGGWKSGASYYLIITQKVLTSANRPLKDEVRMPFHIKAITKAVPTIDVINNGSQMIVKVNGTQLSLKQPPYTVSGHPMVPIKEIAQALGAAVDWDAKNKKMTIMGDKVAELTIGSKTARVNGAAVTLETPAAVTAGTIMAPLSFLQPALGAKVSYTSSNNNNNNVSNKAGNTPGNIINRGLVCRQGDWIYYQNFNNGGRLYKIRTDGSGQTRLSNDSSSYINVVGDWIYYRNNSDGGKLYKIRTNGSGRIRLTDKEVNYVNVVGGWIYYSYDTYYESIYKTKTDGSGQTRLNDDKSSYINVVGDWIYYSNSSDSHRMYKMRLNGSGRTRLNDDESFDINVVGDWIYYINSRRIYKMRTDGSGRTMVNDNQLPYFININVAGDWIYCVGDDYRVYKMKTDGSGRTMLNDANSDDINVDGDWIYYIIDSLRGSEFYKMRTDGSELQLVK